MKNPTTGLESARRHLEALAPLAEELNAASDLVTDELRAIQERLVALNLGVEVVLDKALDGPELPENAGPNDYVVNHCLGFGRHGRGWALLAHEVRKTVFDDDYTDVVPLLESTRDLRIAAAEQIEELLVAINTATKAKIESLDRAVDGGSLPVGWEKFGYGLDESGVVHVFKPRSGDTRCGAEIITTSFDGTPEGRLCLKCRRLMR